MARQRKAKSTAPQVTQDDATRVTLALTNNTSTNSNNNHGGYKMALTQDQINQLLAGSRQKGQYKVILEKFLGSGEAGIDAAEEYPELAGKAHSTVKQGFENAIKGKDAPAGAENVKVIVNGDSDETKRVYLVNLGADSVTMPGAGEPDAEPAAA